MKDEFKIKQVARLSNLRVKVNIMFQLCRPKRDDLHSDYVSKAKGGDMT